MRFTHFVPVLLSTLTAVSNAAPLWKRAADFVDPHTGGGNMGAQDGGVREPINIIISANSSPKVLTNDGFVNYMKSLGFSIECLGQHGGGLFTADLGDGAGTQNQIQELRKDFGVSFLGLGTCLESVVGGNHLRYWRQQGSEALFVAASKEKNLSQHHTVDDDGYNKGRDEIVAKATAKETSHSGVRYKTVAAAQANLLTPGTVIDGLPINHDIAQDGVVQLLTVTIL